ILAAKGAKTYILDLNEPEDSAPTGVTFIKCSTTSWSDLKNAYKQAGHVDIAIANAGVSEEQNYFEDDFDNAGELIEPKYNVIDVNIRGVLMFTKLAVSYMRRQNSGGSIVVTASATAFAPEQNLPVYSATKLGVIGLVRALRSTLPCHDISINAVAPAATITKLLPQHLAKPLMAAGLPISTAHIVGLAVVYSAVAKQQRLVEVYGKDDGIERSGKWNGRTILTLGEDYTELEEPIADLRPTWFGWKNTSLTRQQQTTADFRDL
ncbi:MAG: hypothetical protein Q9164_007319, partial [Protoblastenia rupestris]